jgi:hypothetical protein
MGNVMPLNLRISVTKLLGCPELLRLVVGMQYMILSTATPMRRCWMVQKPQNNPRKGKDQIVLPLGIWKFTK